MRHISHKTITYKQAAVWLLVLAFVSMTLLPYHYHLHHEDHSSPADVTTKSHLVELHSALTTADSDHHQESHTVEPASDIRLKSANIHIPLAILVLSLMLLMPPVIRVYSLRLATESHQLILQRWYTSPLLRAPPAC